MFKVGENVVCINDTMEASKAPELLKYFKQWVVKDEIYTIREFKENDGIVVGVLLEEVKNNEKWFQLLGRFQEPAFSLDRFVKINTTEEENAISELMEMVNSNSETIKNQ